MIATLDTTIKAFGTLNVKPTASFSITQPQSSNPNFIYCTNTSMSNVNYSNSWIFDDGATSNLYSPTHTYPTLSVDKTYKVLLTAKADTTGCTDTISHFITINGVIIKPGCTINYTSRDTCGPGKETFNFTATVNGVPSGSSYYWNYSDGTSDAGNAVSKQFTNAGSYTVTLTFTSSTVTCTQSVNAYGINNFPIANFAYNVNAAGNSFNFKDSSQVKSGSGLRAWYFDFGDSTYAHVCPTSHTYIKGTVQKKYTILYGVAATNGCLSNIQKDIIVPSL